MADLDTREWLLTNGLGSFASGTVSDVRTRTYHGWLFAATNLPSRRTLLFSHLEASLELPKQVIALGTNFWGSGQIDPAGYELLRHFNINPVPKWVWGEDDWQLTRQLVMPHFCRGEREVGRWGGEEKNFTPSSCNRLLIQYRYEGKDEGILRLRLLIADRDFHDQQKATPQLQFSQLLGQGQVCLQGINSGVFGTPWHLRWTRGNYQPDGFWYWNYHLPEETRRGLSDREDLYSPGYLTVTLLPGDVVTLEAKVGFPDLLQSPLTDDTFAEVVEAEQDRLSLVFGWEQEEVGRLGDWENRRWGEKSTPSSFPIWQQLLKASDQFVVSRFCGAEPTVIAGYHWFNDRGRDTLIALPGLALRTQRFDLAKGLLQSLGRHCRHGLIPNIFPSLENEPVYNSIDTALWWIETLGLYLEATQDWLFLAEQYSVIQQIYKAFIGGTRYNIQVDSTDGLIGWDARGVALTWMDAVVDGQPVTPRRGKPVEINALWYSALCWASRWAEILSEQETVAEPSRFAKQARRYSQQAQQVKDSLQQFWNSQLGYLYDTIEPDDHRNSQVRPNAVIALSLAHCAFSIEQGRQILQLATKRLLTPYGLRTLDPGDPEYIGKYMGHPQRRDRSYHQGTVWCWLIGPFIRAWKRFCTTEPLPFDWQPLLEHFLADGCLGSISEIFDGDEPHTPKGAIAQAWSVAEVLRQLEN
ncbi:amylo-alpha-1,6-glucosidase [Fischerella thermalis]|jgi:glycogen debranching enzyme|uniref:Amylo-alpha-16-glucosidase n=2 Tax=Fischerella TaxID=1190 RepID=G6FQ37_9CYAN|nr:amylo-alpha-1,6-glucosidase [Fischerella thermalis]EHC17922.1 Amylo-alpha-16-glucosidase [Fischerella thermalis JSC-11]PLZ06618.1 amylo-alpha-1,6-glucosidase [Fischerella thermalis WC1110]PLZ15580.1 amylo-alpha-1,6-glucosidase [Fischerella thermalis WC119]PLZ15775.1 amylo-alpha-1,6-glucosidase [Fischerella thermalis WC114]PLZ18221.1 amylo-alpha-1,6-glucosidase [Fischerella thermalis WC157]